MSQNPINDMQIALEEELQSQIEVLKEKPTNEFYEMLTFHMGWTGDLPNHNASGKRIRPLLLLLCAASGDQNYAWQYALPGAAAVELLHNFSLIHDDIQDNSFLRRNRPTVWRLWGIPQAINAGDGLYALSNIAINGLTQNNDPDLVVKIAGIFNKTCLNLTRGQYMDMAFEDNNNLTMENYWPMISYKTSALISTSTEIGTILAGYDHTSQEICRQFGHYLGLAFQVKDDILGLWGNEHLTGKSITKDLITGKKTLPILYGLRQEGVFARRWSEGNITEEEAPHIAVQLAKEGAKKYAEDTVDQLTEMAHKYLRIMAPQGSVGQELFDLTNRLLKRDT